MKKQDYLEQLSQALPKNPLSQRFMKEMHDHVEDAEEKGTVKNSLSEFFGETIILQKHFRNVLFQRHLLYGILQTFLLSLLTSLLYIYAFTTQAALTAQIEVGRFPWQAPLTEFIIFIVLFLAYYRGLPEVFDYAPSWRHRLPFIVGFFLFPILFLCLLVLSAIHPASIYQTPATFSGVFVTSFFPFVAGVGLFALASFLRRKMQPTSLLQIIQGRKISFILGILLIGLIILARLIIRWSMDTAAPPEFFDHLPKGFFQIAIGAFMMLDFFSSLIVSLALGFAPLMVRFWVMGIFLVLVAGIILFQLLSYALYRQPRRFPIFRFAIFVYIVLLLALPYQEPSVTSSLPLVNVSGRIEKAQMGPFYSMTKYYNMNEGRYGQYAVYVGENGLVLGQQKGERLEDEDNYFLVDRVQNIDLMDITKTDAPGADYLTLEGSGLPPSVQCVDKKENFGMVYPEDCDTLLYNGQEVFSFAGWHGWARGIGFMQNEEWMIVHVSFGPFDPGAVYLVDLRSLDK